MPSPIIAAPRSTVRIRSQQTGHIQCLAPDRLLVGTGAYQQMRPDPGTLEALRARGVDVEVLPTAEAVRRYAQLDPHKTAAALHLTC